MSLLHIARSDDWEASIARGQYRVSTRGGTLDQVGFIHASSSNQVSAVADFAYADEPDALVVLVIDDDALDRAGIAVRYQDGGNGALFPHIFGALTPDLVTEVRPAAFVDGCFAWLRASGAVTFVGTIAETDVAGAVAAERELLDPAVRRDHTAVDRLLAPGFSEIGQSGRLWQRGELVDELGQSESSESLIVNELEGRILAPGLVLLRYESTTVDSRALRSSLWRLTEQGWRIEFHQGTPL